MLHLPELRLQVAAHTLCRRVGVVHLGMTLLQLLQLVHQLVEVIVADNGLVLDVVSVVMLVQLAPQLFYAFFLVHENVDKLDSIGRKVTLFPAHSRTSGWKYRPPTPFLCFFILFPHDIAALSRSFPIVPLLPCGLYPPHSSLN